MEREDDGVTDRTAECEVRKQRREVAGRQNGDREIALRRALGERQPEESARVRCFHGGVRYTAHLREMRHDLRVRNPSARCADDNPGEHQPWHARGRDRSASRGVWERLGNRVTAAERGGEYNREQAAVPISRADK